jgi:toxin CcdB
MAQLVARQFAIVANPTPQMRSRAPYLLVMQSHHLSSFDTGHRRAVDPGRNCPAGQRTSLAVEFEGEAFTIAIALMANIERRALGRTLGDLQARDYEIQRALDRVFMGF